MGRFDGVLLASDFDNTLIYTEEALRSGVPVPPLSDENREALEWFMAEGGDGGEAKRRRRPHHRGGCRRNKGGEGGSAPKAE